MARQTTEEAITEGLYKTFGNVSETARALGISPRALRMRISGNDELESVRDEARSLFLDNLEHVNREQALKPENTTERIFTLKTLGKSRGYIERQELTGADGAPVFNIHIGPDDGPANG